MKKTISILLAVLLLFSLCSCGEPEEEKTSGELDGQIWPLSRMTTSDSDLDGAALNAVGLIGAITFYKGEFTLILDTTAFSGTYVTTEKEITLTTNDETFSLTRSGNTAALDMSGVVMSFTRDTAAAPFELPLDLDGTSWKLIHLAGSDAEQLAESKVSGTLSFADGVFHMTVENDGVPTEQQGTYLVKSVFVMLDIEGQSVYGRVDGNKLSISESGFDTIYEKED